MAIIYILHRLEEIFELCSRVTVFEDGSFVATEPVAVVSHDILVSLMVGCVMSELFPPTARVGEDRPVVLSAKDISAKGRVHMATIELRAGEITALSGMVGAGRTELAMAIFGGIPTASGEITGSRVGNAPMLPELLYQNPLANPFAGSAPSLTVCRKTVAGQGMGW